MLRSFFSCRSALEIRWHHTNLKSKMALPVSSTNHSVSGWERKKEWKTNKVNENEAANSVVKIKRLKWSTEKVNRLPLRCETANLVGIPFRYIREISKWNWDVCYSQWLWMQFSRMANGTQYTTLSSLCELFSCDVVNFFFFIHTKKVFRSFDPSLLLFRFTQNDLSNDDDLRLLLLLDGMHSTGISIWLPFPELNSNHIIH